MILVAREDVRRFLNAPSLEEVIFTGGATDALNLVAQCYGADHICEGDEIILSEMEHHSNIVPWHYLREHKGAVIRWVRVHDDGSFDMEDYKNLLGPKTKFVALTQMSNALGTITPMKEIIRLHMNTSVLVDGCQGPCILSRCSRLIVIFMFYPVQALWPVCGALRQGYIARPYRGGENIH